MIKSILIIFFLSVAHAGVIFNNVTYKGTGCPEGSVSTVISPDGSSFSVLFDEFRAEVPQYDGINDNADSGGRRRATQNTASLSYKKCQLSFQASLPPGTAADTLQVELQARGATMIDQGVEGFFASILVGYSGLSNSRGSPTMVIQKHWRGIRGPVDNSWSAAPVSTVALRSACATATNNSVRFDLKNHIQAEIPSGDLKKSGLITVDSADARGLLKFTLTTSPCRGR
jgi:hypothetical protein